MFYLIRTKKGFRLELFVALSVSCILTVLVTMFETDTNALENKLTELVILNSTVIFLPATLILGIIELSNRYLNGLIKHISIIAMSIITALINLAVGLSLSCNLSLGCV